MEQERAEAKKALAEALQGKWEATGEGWFNTPNCAKIVVKDEWGQTYVARTFAGMHQLANAHLIANAPTWLRNSLDREEQLEQTIRDKDEHIRALRIAKEHEIECHLKSCLDHQEEVLQLIAENERIKATLAWYADHTNYHPYRFMCENGKRAREALNQS